MREHRGPFLMGNIERRVIKRKGKLSRSVSVKRDIAKKLICAVTGFGSRLTQTLLLHAETAGSRPQSSLALLWRAYGSRLTQTLLLHAETAGSRYICVKCTIIGDACKARNLLLWFALYLRMLRWEFIEPTKNGEPLRSGSPSQTSNNQKKK